MYSIRASIFPIIFNNLIILSFVIIYFSRARGDKANMFFYHKRFKASADCCAWMQASSVGYWSSASCGPPTKRHKALWSCKAATDAALPATRLVFSFRSFSVLATCCCRRSKIMDAKSRQNGMQSLPWQYLKGILHKLLVFGKGGPF